MDTAFLSAAPYLPLVGPLVVILAWAALREQPTSRARFLGIWLLVLSAQIGGGWLAGHLDPDATRRGLALLYSSTTWLVGPALLPLVGRGPQMLVGLVLGTVTPAIGGVLGIFTAFATGVINPCG
ncbi:MAG: hypothetical protein OEZ06_16250 [Myxococcales bacterium]|nr:hypothetical protein [Myxococcales bacterium]